MSQKETFGEFGAFVARGGGIRFQKNNRLIKESAIPPEVADFLRKKLNVPRVAAEPTQTPEPVHIPVQDDTSPVDEVPLTPADFEEPVGSEEPVDSNGNPPLPSKPELTRADEPVMEPRQPDENDYLEQVSIHTASLADMAQAMFDRFGIYSVWLGRYPQPEEVNPLTGHPITNYERGVAYQAAVRAENQGLKDPTIFRRSLDESIVAQANFDKSFEKPANTMDEKKAADNFDWRTSVESGLQTPQDTPLEHYTDKDGEVHARRAGANSGEQVGVSESGSVTQAHSSNDGISDDEPTAEPQIGKKVIRPVW